MKLTLTRLLGINLFLSFGIGLAFSLSGAERGIFLFASGTTAIVIGGLNLGFGLLLLVARRGEWGKMFLASGGLLLLIGFSTCFGGAVTSPIL